MGRCQSEAVCVGMALLKLPGIGMRLDGAAEVRMIGLVVNIKSPHSKHSIFYFLFGMDCVSSHTF